MGQRFSWRRIQPWESLAVILWPGEGCDPEDAEWKRVLLTSVDPFLSHVYSCCSVMSANTDALFVYYSLGWFPVNCSNCTINACNCDTSSFDLNLGLFLPYHIPSEGNVFIQYSKHTFFESFSLCLLPSSIAY